MYAACQMPGPRTARGACRPNTKVGLTLNTLRVWMDVDGGACVGAGAAAAPADTTCTCAWGSHCGIDVKTIASVLYVFLPCVLWMHLPIRCILQHPMSCAWSMTVMSGVPGALSVPDVLGALR